MNNNKMVKYFLALFLTLTCLALTNTSTQPQKNDMPEKEVIEGMIYRWNYEGAIPAAEALLSKAKDNVSRAMAHLLIARAWSIKGIEYRDAIAREAGKKHILEAFALAPSLKNEPDVANLRAQLMVFQMPKTPCESALAEARREAEKEPDLAQTHFYLGLISFKLSSNDAFAPNMDEKAKLSDIAISEMKKAVQLDPKRYEYRAYYITALFNADKKEEARREAEDMMKSADISPDKIPPSCSIPDVVYVSGSELNLMNTYIDGDNSLYGVLANAGTTQIGDCYFNRLTNYIKRLGGTVSVSNSTYGKTVGSVTAPQEGWKVMRQAWVESATRGTEDAFRYSVDGEGTMFRVMANGDLWTSGTIQGQGVLLRQGNTLIVAKSGGDYTTIQAAVDAAVAGTTIMVYPGTYDLGIDTLTISTNNITIMGMSKTGTIITTNKSSAELDLGTICILSDDCEISNITIQNTGSGADMETALSADGVENLLLNNCILIGGRDTIFVFGDSDNVTILNSHIMGDWDILSMAATGPTYTHINAYNCIFEKMINYGSGILWIGGGTCNFYNCQFINIYEGGYIFIGAERVGIVNIYKSENLNDLPLFHQDGGATLTFNINGLNFLNVGDTCTVNIISDYIDTITVRNPAGNVIGYQNGYDNIGLYLYGNVSPATSAATYGIRNGYILNPLATYNGYSSYVGGTINKAATGTHSLFASLYLAPPTIGAGASTLTEAATLYISGDPTGATANYAIHVASGEAAFDGGLVSNTTIWEDFPTGQEQGGNSVNMEAHTHDVSGSTDDPGNHTHTIDGGQHSFSWGSDSSATDGSGSHTHTVSGAAAASTNGNSWHPAAGNDVTYMHCTADAQCRLFRLPYRAGTILTRLRVEWQAEGNNSGVKVRLVKRALKAASWTTVGAQQTYTDSASPYDITVCSGAPEYYDFADETTVTGYVYGIEVESEVVSTGTRLYSVGIETSKRVL
ncbi:MAG: hypothetical protein NT106_10225 [Candidatus Sumerlaeota bacterium]|nr:hypothetical protein [Candidatus Sumerlaeota bacterium]